MYLIKGGIAKSLKVLNIIMLDIYVISLNNSQLRRDFLKKQFPKYYKTMNLIEAVNGSELEVNYYFNEMVKFEKIYNRIITPNELACTLSHINTLKAFLKTNNRHALILEDDVIGDDTAIDNLINILNIEKLEGIMLCGGQEGLPSDWRRFCYGVRSQSDESLFIVDPYSIKYFSRAVCYVVNRDFALNYIEKNLNIVLLADDWAKYVGSSKHKFYFKKLFSHPVNNDVSTIEGQRLLIEQGGNNSYFLRKDFLKKATNKINNIFHLCIFKVKGLININ